MVLKLAGSSGKLLLDHVKENRSARANMASQGNIEESCMTRLNKLTLAVLSVSLITLYGCQDLVPRDTASLLIPTLQRSEIFGFVAGFGTTFAALPDLLAMLRRR